MCQPQLQHPPALVSDQIIPLLHIWHLVTPACAPLSVESIGLKSIPSADGEYSAKNSKSKKNDLNMEVMIDLILFTATT